MLMHREILLWYVAPATSRRVHSAGSGYYVMYAMLQLQYLHYYNRRTDGTKVSIEMTHLYWYNFKDSNQKGLRTFSLSWAYNKVIRCSCLHKRAEWMEGARTCARLQAGAEHHQLMGTTCHHHVSRVPAAMWGPWVTGWLDNKDM